MFFTLYKPTARYGFIRNKVDSALPIFTVGNHMSRKFIDYINIYPWCAERNFNIRIWYFVRCSLNLFLYINHIFLFLKNFRLMIHLNPFIEGEFFKVFFGQAVNNLCFRKNLVDSVAPYGVIFGFIDGIISVHKFSGNLFSEQIAVYRCGDFVGNISFFFLCIGRLFFMSMFLSSSFQRTES